MPGTSQGNSSLLTSTGAPSSQLHGGCNKELSFLHVLSFKTLELYARDFVETSIKKDINPERVWMQSFNPTDIFQWLKEYPAFERQGVYPDESRDSPEKYTAAVALLPSLKKKGVNIISPPINYLLQEAGPNDQIIVPAPDAIVAKRVGLDIITWTFESSGPLAGVKVDEDYYYTSIQNATHTDGQLYEVLNILAQEAGIKGIFSDWSAMVTYYANWFGLSGPNANDYK
jgi:glycerophosphoryl diester phosphodiesterase